MRDYPKVDLLTNSTHSLSLLIHLFFLDRIKKLVNLVTHTAFTSFFSFNALADKRHSSVAF